MHSVHHKKQISKWVSAFHLIYKTNAVQNSTENSNITVSLYEHNDKIRLSVENSVMHISDDLKDKIWTEAFTTLPEGRENTGLGLYIVKEIAIKERTNCGFDNTEKGVRFWFDFIDYYSNND